MKPFLNTAVAEVFESYPEETRSKLMVLRQLIFDAAAETEGVGEIEETLKWGEPAYLTSKSKSGTTIRINCRKSDTRKYAMHFHCQTNLVETFRRVFPNDFVFEANRAIVFDQDDELPIEELSFCIAAALTYHRNKKSKS